MRLHRAVGLLLAGTSALAACGGDNNDTASTTSTTAHSGDAADGIGAIAATRCGEVAAALGRAAASVPLALVGRSGDFGQSIDQLKAFSGEAPAAIRADVDTVAEGYAAVTKVLADAKFDPNIAVAPDPAVLLKLQDAGQKLNQPDFVAALGRVNKWFADECGK